MGDSDSSAVPFGYAPRNLATDPSDLSLQLPQPGFLCVLLDDDRDCRSREVQIAWSYPIFFHLLGEQVAPGNFTLLFFSVTRKADHFHPVAKRRLNRVQHVCRCHEYDLRQVERNTEIVIAEAVVLFGIEDFEQSRRRIASEVRAN